AQSEAVGRPGRLPAGPDQQVRRRTAAAADAREVPSAQRRARREPRRAPRRYAGEPGSHRARGVGLRAHLAARAGPGPGPPRLLRRGPGPGRGGDASGSPRSRAGRCGMSRPGLGDGYTTDREAQCGVQEIAWTLRFLIARLKEIAAGLPEPPDLEAMLNG